MICGLRFCFILTFVLSVETVFAEETKIASFFAPKLEEIKKINSEDPEAKKTSDLISLFERRSYLSCTQKSLQNLETLKPSDSFFAFEFMYGVKCLLELKPKENSHSTLMQSWMEFYFTQMTLDIKRNFHGAELELYDNYMLKLAELIYLNTEASEFTLEQTDFLKQYLQQTKNEKVIGLIFSSYVNKNNLQAAKEFLLNVDPKLEEVSTLEMLNKHFEDEVYGSRIKEIRSSKSEAQELKRLYSRNKYLEFLEYLKKTNLVFEDDINQSSRQAGWLYVRGKEDFRSEVTKNFNNLNLNYNDFFWILSNQGLFKDILKAYEVLSDDKKKSNMSMALKAYIYSGQYEAGYKFIQAQKFEDNISAVKPTLLFYSALIYIRFGKIKEALPFLNHLADIDSDYKLQALYLTYNILKDLNKSEAKKYAETLTMYYPLTYYGLVAAHKEKITSKLPFFEKKPEPKIQFAFDNPLEKRKLKHIALIYDLKLNSKFRKFLDATLNALSFESQLIWAYRCLLEGEPLSAIKIMNVVWTSRRDWIHPSIIPIAYPTDYVKAVKEHSVSGIDPLLVLGLIRQESAFQKNATSQAKARGLMQLLSATAKEMARALRLYKVALPWGLYQPEINIRLGSSYLKRRIESYKGHVPLALASYNVGPGRLQKWSLDRDLITMTQENLSSQDWKVQDLWVEELPWEETRFYVKAVLRNYVLYTLFLDYKPLKTCPRRWNCEEIK